MVVDALIVVDLAPAPREAPGAVAGVGVDPVLASPAVVARVGRAVVYVALAVGPEPAVDAGTLIAVDPINTDTVVVTGIRSALVNINLAILSSVTCEEKIFQMRSKEQ